MGEISATVKLIGIGIAALFAAALLTLVFSFFSDYDQGKKTREAGKRIKAEQARIDKASEAKRNAAKAYDAAVASQVNAYVTEQKKDEAVFDSAAISNYFRLWDAAICGPESCAGKPVERVRSARAPAGGVPSVQGR